MSAGVVQARAGKACELLATTHALCFSLGQMRCMRSHVEVSCMQHMYDIWPCAGLPGEYGAGHCFAGDEAVT